MSDRTPKWKDISTAVAEHLKRSAEGGENESVRLLRPEHVVVWVEGE